MMYHLVISHIELENPLCKWRFLLGKSICFYGSNFSIAMLNYQRVNTSPVSEKSILYKYGILLYLHSSTNDSWLVCIHIHYLFLKTQSFPTYWWLKYYLEFLNLPIPDISGLVFVPISHPIHPIPWSFDEKGMAMLPSAAL